MLDDFSLLSSTFCILYVFWRAAMLDKLPWFERQAQPERKTVSPSGERKTIPPSGERKMVTRRDDVLHRYYPWR